MLLTLVSTVLYLRLVYLRLGAKAAKTEPHTNLLTHFLPLARLRVCFETTTRLQFETNISFPNYVVIYVAAVYVCLGGPCYI